MTRLEPESDIDSDTVPASYVLSVAILHLKIRAQVRELYYAVQSRLLLLPLLGSCAIGAAAAGIVSHKKNLTFWALTISSLLMFVASALLTRILKSDSSLPQERGYLAILGLGAGMSIATTMLLATLLLGHGKSRHGVIALMRIPGASIGSAVGFILLHTRFTRGLHGAFTPEQLSAFDQSPLSVSSFTAPQLLLDQGA
ncbi:major facilitator superfamily transporter [Cordyceps fumosorosea ARSEF 2679]|uniref:Major facilitator superfamily transporter n=1 Tax=Cordyceps fumosorosea (strain ARSEF 2679) TaxID=1081104 RepID=A0A167ZDG4_CORFA|nr:major facilitator superfamily transporter [Cordyceps fumosorosea ARSEF 2679]OAA67374.1 major facilitator superfamily transporter [Cordyceps fumosorosea ARSEF 2679]